MAFCQHCGKELEENQNFCPNCGGGQGEHAAPVAPPAADGLSSNDKLMAVLSYFGLLVLVPIFAAKDSKFARFHANQGLLLFIVEIVWQIAAGIVGGVLSAIGISIVANLLDLVGLVFLVFAIMGIVYAAKGEEKELPVIGQYKILK